MSPCSYSGILAGSFSLGLLPISVKERFELNVPKVLPDFSWMRVLMKSPCFPFS